MTLKKDRHTWVLMVVMVIIALGILVGYMPWLIVPAIPLWYVFMWKWNNILKEWTKDDDQEDDA